MGIHRIHEQITIPATLEEVWEFISSPGNLREITPAYMGFEITTPDLPDQMYPGMIISYKVAPLFGIRLTWVTEITQVREKHYFVDEQRMGPYAMWHHEHFIEPTDHGIRMTDIVSYKLPLGFLGRLAHRAFIKKQLRDIFRYRKHALELRFGKA
jgi:ligand-binding SRPBCC domain-containing protein